MPCLAGAAPLDGPSLAIGKGIREAEPLEKQRLIGAGARYGAMPCIMRSSSMVLTDVLELVSEWLELPAIAQVLAVSRSVRTVVDSPASWQRYAACLWRGRYVPPASRLLLEHGEARSAVRTCMADLKRDTITAEELCGCVWHCRAKRCGRKSWIRNDPWWQGHPAQRRRFAPSGEVLEPGQSDGSWQVVLIMGQPITWRFATWIPVWDRSGAQPVALPVPKGTRVKVADFPTTFVWRHPLTWGFVLESPCMVMTSFEMPLRAAASAGSRAERELAQSLQGPQLHDSPVDSVLEMDFFRNDIAVPDRQPAPEDFFARESEDGSMRFFIRAEQEDGQMEVTEDDVEDYEGEEEEMDVEEEEESVADGEEDSESEGSESEGWQTSNRSQR